MACPYKQKHTSECPTVCHSTYCQISSWVCKVSSKQYKGCYAYKLGVRRDIKPETPATINEVDELAALMGLLKGGEQ